jgi:homoserine dehydrogenase
LGVIGLGTVGSGVVRLLQQRREAIRASTGADLELVVAADIDPGCARALDLDEGLFVNNAEQVLARQDLDLVVELIGGLEPARSIVRQALATGRSVVTANKHLLAESYSELTAAREGDSDLYFEAAVAGGIPILKSMREGLAANNIQAVIGIVNGTCNYILTEMSKRGEQFDKVLAEAQRAGYAEESPELDVDGHDSAHKLTVLATLAFQRLYALRDIYVEGIGRITPADINYAAEMGYVIKLLAIGRRTNADAGVELRVHPTLLRTHHPLAAVDGVFNAVVVETDTAGRLMFYGQGAGQDPTASAVVADIIDAATRTARKRPVADLQVGEVCPMEQLTTQYFIRFNAADRYRVLGTIATELGQHRVSIQQVIQMEKRPDGVVPVVMFTHPAREADVQRAIERIDGNDFILEPTALIRVSADGA